MTHRPKIGPLAAAMVGAVLLALAGCGSAGIGPILVGGTTSSDSLVAAVRVTPDTVRFSAIAQTAQLTATAVDSVGNEVTGASVTWASGDGTIASVDGDGLVTSVGAGQTTITATSGAAQGTASVIVTTSGALPVGAAPGRR